MDSSSSDSSQNSFPALSSATSSQEAPSSTRGIPRNEPCPCGSGKKYKRCHGVDAQPVLQTPRAIDPLTGGVSKNSPLGAMTPPGFDPSQMDPVMMQNAMKALQRLPKPQLIKLQGIMQRAMSGQDVTREAAELERMLPPEFQQMMTGVASQMGTGAQADSPRDGSLTEEEAKRIVADAAREGKISSQEAEKLLAPSSDSTSTTEKKGISQWLKGWGSKK